MERPALRVEKGAPRAFGRRAEERIAAQAPLIDDRRLPDGAVGIDRHLYLDDEILCVAGAGRNVPAARDLVADRVEFARGELASERSLRLRGRPRGCDPRVLWRRIGRRRGMQRRQIFQQGIELSRVVFPAVDRQAPLGGAAIRTLGPRSMISYRPTCRSASRPPQPYIADQVAAE